MMLRIIWILIVTTRPAGHRHIPINSIRNRHLVIPGRQIVVLVLHKVVLVARESKVVKRVQPRVYREHRTPVSSSKTKRAPR